MLIPPIFKKRKKLALSGLLLLLLFLGVGIAFLLFIPESKIKTNDSTIEDTAKERELDTSIVSEKPISMLITPPPAKTLTGGIQIFQLYNNCGPASLSMALSYYGINVSQEDLGNALRPYQIAFGDNDDKSTTLEELAEKSKDYGLTPFHRPVGNPELVKLFIAHDLPVIARTWTTPNEDIGHYRIVKGYDATGFIQDDSLQGKDIYYPYAEFDAIWKQFNYEYLVLAPEDKIATVEQILGPHADLSYAWQEAVENARDALTKNPDDIHAGFNLSVALYNIGDFQESADEFEKVESRLSFRTLWYQIEPIQAYYELGNYTRVFEMTDKILNNQNRAFSELYIIRGNIYKNEGKMELARGEYEKAIRYNVNLKSARDALATVQ